jgi:hypothetical protein
LHTELVPRPDENQIALVVARHQARLWPSAELADYAQQRSRLLHSLADDLGIQVVSWGEIDGTIPREVVKVVLDLSQVIVPSLATVLAAWIMRQPRKVELAEESGDPKPAMGHIVSVARVGESRLIAGGRT